MLKEMKVEVIERENTMIFVLNMVNSQKQKKIPLTL
jgi:hypothetical protein